MRIRGMSAGLLLLTVMGGCSAPRVGAPFSRDKLRDVVVGRTNREEVTKWFGQPSKTTHASGHDLLIYQDYDGVRDANQVLFSVDSQSGLVLGHVAK